MRHATGRVSKEQWLNAALELLASEGVSSVRVDKLSKSLSISRSGFYWHFADRSALLNEMKEYWQREFTEKFVATSNGNRGSPAERLRDLSRSIRVFGANRFDLAFWSWAQTDVSVQDAVERVKDTRSKYVRNLFRELGFQGADLDARERIFVVYHSWGSLMYEVVAEGADAAATDRILEILAGR